MYNKKSLDHYQSNPCQLRNVNNLLFVFISNIKYINEKLFKLQSFLFNVIKTYTIYNCIRNQIILSLIELIYYFLQITHHNFHFIFHQIYSSLLDDVGQHRSHTPR